MIGLQGGCMDFLITGAPGWLSNRFIEVLTKPGKTDGSLHRVLERTAINHIRCLVLPDVDTLFIRNLPGGVQTVTGDITKIDSLVQFFEHCREAVLFHLAGLIHPQRRIRELYDVNVEGTRNVLNMAVRHGLKKVVVVSSNSPFGCNQNKQGLFDESAPYRPYLAYGRSKMLLENIVEIYRQQYGLDITVLRPCWFYGPHQPARQTTFFTMIKEGNIPLVGDGTNKRSMSYVDNTCQALLLSAINPKSSQKTYWIADEKPYSMLEIIQCIRDVLSQDFGIKIKPSVLKLPWFASEVAYCADRLIQGLGWYHQKIHVLSEMNKTIACSVELAKRELGYKPDIYLREGMKRSVAWCLDQGYRI